MEVTIGGERIGSGSKMKTDLNNYGRSNHNLTQSCKTTMAPGVLYPFLKLIGTNGDTFDIDLDAIVRTVPTKGPLFGSFKLQLDVYSVPIRLYQGLLHNNPINIGLDMSKIKLPKIKITTNDPSAEGTVIATDFNEAQFSNNCLMKYLGVSGIGVQDSKDYEMKEIQRYFNAVPILAYYDIFKNYYANKQEENAYVITPNVYNGGTFFATINGEDVTEEEPPYTINNREQITITGQNLNPANIICTITWVRGNTSTASLQRLAAQGDAQIIQENENHRQIIFKFLNNWVLGRGMELTIGSDASKPQDIQLTTFPLSNIDEMRKELLAATELNEAYEISSNSFGLPYDAVANVTDDESLRLWNSYKMNGLVVKTYQSDLFNNWLDTEFITGDNGIEAVTSVDTSQGFFTLDTLNLAQKVYNMLNRIALSGGTYQDWQEAVYTERAIRHAETPMYMGGMSSEVVFEEVISTAKTGEDNSDQLGTLSGKGRLLGKKGGSIKIKIEEPSYIIGIASLTPRIDYCQGNDFDMTELESLNDLHKPALDGIGFQNLITERMAWWDTKFDENGTMTRYSAGKVPSWIEYTTAVDKAYGEFANNDEAGYMVLKRDYDYDESYRIKDLTTYIEPQKFNYAFAYTKLDAQNFWAQIVSKITARRVMSAKIIPNL